MKFVPLMLVLICAPLPALARDTAPREIAIAGHNEATTDRISSRDSYQIAYADTANRSISDDRVLTAPLKFSAYPDLYDENAGRTEHAETGTLADWRERVFLSLNRNIDPQQYDRMDRDRLANNEELEKQATDTRKAIKVVVQETMKYTRERIPGIDRLINAMRFEFSNIPGGTGALGKKNGDDRTGGKPVVNGASLRQDKLYFKTGLRLPVAGGKVSLVSESEARLGKVSSFMNIHLDGQYDRSVGLTYVLGRNMHLQVERWDAHTTDALSGEKSSASSSVDLIQVVYAF